MITKRTTFKDTPGWGPGYEPKVVITIEGWSDVIRFADHLQHGQVEFANVGRLILDRIRRKQGGKDSRRTIDWYLGKRTS